LIVRSVLLERSTFETSVQAGTSGLDLLFWCPA
jgi:hypothetical protein